MSGGGAIQPQCREQLYALVRSWENLLQVCVHGDITAENVRIPQENDAFLLDFADCTMAPAAYELPPILLDLFDMDRDLFAAYLEDEDLVEMVDALFQGMLMHDFGGFIARDILGRLLGKKLCEVENLFEIRDALHRHYTG